MAKYKINPDLNRTTKKYMQSVIDKLSDSDGNIDEVWFASLDLIASNYDTINQCQAQIKSDGLMIVNRFGDRVAHPLIKVSENASIQLQKLLGEFLLTKRSEIKIDSNQNDSDDESPLSKFLSKKINQ